MMSVNIDTQAFIQCDRQERIAKDRVSFLLVWLFLVAPLPLLGCGMSPPFKDAAMRAPIAVLASVQEVKSNEVIVMVEEVFFGKVEQGTILITAADKFVVKLQQSITYFLLLNDQLQPYGPYDLKSGWEFDCPDTNVLTVVGKDAKGFYEMTPKKLYDSVPLRWVKKQLKHMKKR